MMKIEMLELVMFPTWQAVSQYGEGMCTRERADGGRQGAQECVQHQLAIESRDL